MKNIIIKNRNNFQKHFRIAADTDDRPMNLPKMIAKHCKSSESPQDYLERLVRTMRRTDHNRPVVLVTDTNLIGTQEQDGTYILWWMTNSQCVEYLEYNSMEAMEKDIQSVGEFRLYDPYAGVF